jgi:hypothetical protein
MVSVLASGVVDRGFEHCSGQTKILLFSASPLSTQLQGVRARNRGVLLERHVYPWFSEQGIMVSYWSDMFTHDSVSKESWCPSGATCLPMIQRARNRGVLLERHVYPWFSEQGIMVSYWSDMFTHDSASKESWCPTGATCLPMIQWARNRGVLVERHVYPWFSEQGIAVS